MQATLLPPKNSVLCAPIIGDGVRTGVDTSIEAGVKISIARTTKPGSYVEKDMR